MRHTFNDTTSNSHGDRYLHGLDIAGSPKQRCNLINFSVFDGSLRVPRAEHCPDASSQLGLGILGERFAMFLVDFVVRLTEFFQMLGT